MAIRALKPQIRGVENELELPYEQDGSVDWNTLGNIITAHTLGEVLQASYVDHSFGRKEASEFKADTNWIFDYKQDEIVVLKKSIPDSPLNCFMGRGVIDVPARVLAAFLKDIKQNFKWDKLLVEARYLETLSESEHHTDFIGYQRYETTHCLTAITRDSLYYLRCIFHDGMFIHSAMSICHPDYPPIEDLPRVVMRVGSGFVLEPFQGSETRTLVSYLAHIDLRLRGLPASLINFTLRNYPLVIHAIARHVRPQASLQRETFLGRLREEEKEEKEEQHQTNRTTDLASSSHTISEETDRAGNSKSQIRVVQSELELTYEQDGSVDWNTLGNTLTAHTLEEVLQASYVDNGFSRQEASESKDDMDWIFDYKKDNVVILKKSIPNSPLNCFIGRGVIDVPVGVLAAFLKDIKQNFKWDKLLVEARYLETLSESEHHTDFIGYQRYETTHCLTSIMRDSLYYVRCIFHDRKFIQSAISIWHPDYPPIEDTPRLVVRIGSGFVLEPFQGSETRTLVSYLAHVDLGLRGIPASLMNFTLRQYPLVIHAIARHVTTQTPMHRVSLLGGVREEDEEEGQHRTSRTAHLTSGSHALSEEEANRGGSSNGHLSSANPELPTDKDGGIDWSTLGNILTAHILGEVLQASYVDERHGKRGEHFQVDTEWEFAYEKSDVIVLKKRISGSPLMCFMGRGVIEVPLKEVTDFVGDIDTTFVWDKFCIEAKLLKVLSRSEHHVDYVGYQQFESAQCFTAVKRDSLYYVRMKHMADGKYVQTVLSVDDPDYPPTAGIPRLEIQRGSGFVMEPFMGGTLVSYLAHVDLKKLPTIIMNNVVKYHPMVIHQIRRHLTRGASPSTAKRRGDQRGRKKSRARSWRIGRSSKAREADGISDSSMQVDTRGHDSTQFATSDVYLAGQNTKHNHSDILTPRRARTESPSRSVDISFSFSSVLEALPGSHPHTGEDPQQDGGMGQRQLGSDARQQVPVLLERREGDDIEKRTFLEMSYSSSDRCQRCERSDFGSALSSRERVAVASVYESCHSDFTVSGATDD